MFKVKEFLIKVGWKMRDRIDIISIHFACISMFAHLFFPKILKIIIVSVSYCAMFFVCLATAMTCYSKDTVVKNNLITIALSDISVVGIILLSVYVFGVNLMPFKKSIWILLMVIIGAILEIVLSFIISNWFKKKIIK